MRLCYSRVVQGRHICRSPVPSVSQYHSKYSCLWRSSLPVCLQGRCDQGLHSRQSHLLYKCQCFLWHQVRCTDLLCKVTFRLDQAKECCTLMGAIFFLMKKER